MDITKEDFEQWANSPVTHKVRNYLIEQRNDFASLDNTFADTAAMDSPDFNLETLGLNAACRMSVVRGIDMFTNIDDLYREFFPESAEKEESDGV